MKKAARNILVVMFITLFVFALTGCGKKQEEPKVDKIVATRTQTEEGIGEFVETIEFAFKDDKADTITMIMDFDSEETAKAVASIFKLKNSLQDLGMETRQDGTKFIMTMNAATYARQQEIEEGQLSKESLRQSLEQEGYTIQE